MSFIERRFCCRGRCGFLNLPIRDHQALSRRKILIWISGNFQEHHFFFRISKKEDNLVRCAQIHDSHFGNSTIFGFSGYFSRKFSNHLRQFPNNFRSFLQNGKSPTSRKSCYYLAILQSFIYNRFSKVRSTRPLFLWQFLCHKCIWSCRWQSTYLSAVQSYVRQ